MKDNTTLVKEGLKQLIECEKKLLYICDMVCNDSYHELTGLGK